MNHPKYGVAVFNYKQFMQLAAYCFMRKIKYEYQADTGVVFFDKETHQSQLQKVLGR